MKKKKKKNKFLVNFQLVLLVFLLNCRISLYIFTLTSNSMCDLQILLPFSELCFILFTVFFKKL